MTSNRPARTVARIALTVDADFADQFELRFENRVYEKPGAVRSALERPDGVEFGYERVAPSGEPSWHSRTVVRAVPSPEAVARPGEGTARILEWRMELPPHGEAEILVQACALPSGTTPSSPPHIRPPGDALARVAADNESFAGTYPRPRDVIGWTELARACEQGLADLAGLRAPATGPDGEPLRVPAAGIPWYLALVGRDALLTSLFALPYRPGLAAATLPALAAAQGGTYDPERQEQPGRIVHELRHGELSCFRQVPYGRYYGAVDSTPLFLVLLHAYTERTSDTGLAVALEKPARSAVDWMFRDGGLSGLGWLACAAPGGVEGTAAAGRSWKDTPGALCFGREVRTKGPVAVAEVQGYAYDALVRTAALARTVWEDPGLAGRLETARPRCASASTGSSGWTGGTSRRRPWTRRGGGPRPWDRRRGICCGPGSWTASGARRSGGACWSRTSSAAGASGRSRRTSPPTTRSRTTRAPCGRTTTRWPSWGWRSTG